MPINYSSASNLNLDTVGVDEGLRAREKSAGSARGGKLDEHVPE